MMAGEKLRMYCIDVPWVPESSDACTFHGWMNSGPARAASVNWEKDYRLVLYLGYY